MTTMKFVLLLFSVLSSSCVFGQIDRHERRLLGEYDFYNLDSLVQYHLRLEKGGTFQYVVQKDLASRLCDGYWKMQGDTIHLRSRHQVDSVGIKVVEIESNNFELQFEPVINSKGELLGTALLVVNGDTSRLIDPLNYTGSLRKGEVKEIKVMINKIISKPYYVVNPRATKFEITLDIERLPDNYLFLKDKSMLFRDNDLYLINDGKIDSTLGNDGKMRPIIIKKRTHL